MAQEPQSVVPTREDLRLARSWGQTQDLQRVLEEDRRRFSGVPQQTPRSIVEAFRKRQL